MITNVITQDLIYLAIFSFVLILPKLLIRFKFPTGITALILGIAFGHFSPELQDDKLFRFLSQIGITSLFLFAGLEVDFKELKEDRVYLSKYLFKFFIVLCLIATVVMYVFGINFQNSAILSLGIFTPSAGFILSSLHSYNVSEDQEYWVKSKAISKELLSVILLFVALQGDNLVSLGTSLAFFIGLFLLLPKVFQIFFKFISPYAPNSEIPFLVVLSLIAGVLAKELGTYYLVGAFIVGLVGSRFKEEIFKEGQEALFKSLSGFFSVFLPFYFFYAGLDLSISKFNFLALTSGALLFIFFVPLRIFLINYSLKSFLKDFKADKYKVSLSLMPTLIFGLVIADILLDRGEVDESIVFGLICYTLLTSLVPAIFFYLLDRYKIKSTN